MSYTRDLNEMTVTVVCASNPEGNYAMYYSDIDCQKRLIKTFLNSVFVYDDKVVLTFNYSGDNRVITLNEIDGGLGHSVCIPSGVVYQ